MYLFQLLGTLVLLVLNSPFILAAVPFLSLIYIRVAAYYRSSSRELQRLDSISKSPIYAAFGEALTGAATIHAFGSVERFGSVNMQKFDYNMRASWIALVANRWLSIRLEFISNIMLWLTAMLAVVTFIVQSGGDVSGAHSSVKAGLAGLALSYAPGLTDTLNFMLRQLTSVEAMMVSVERLLQYKHLEVEESSDPRQTAPSNWPSQGAISFSGVTMRYRENLPLVLSEMDLEVNPHEKIGIVGRTGAGKSSVLVALFRLTELTSGTISIDGVDISKLALSALRAKLAIIPQDPVLFTGSLRYNLDPFNEHSDAALWDTLDACKMAEATRAHGDGLARTIEERGGNLSMGQRQLVCMARALLRNATVLVLDEATASVDMETDDIIQQTLREKLAHATVLTIAHRLDTIMHCDRVVVMHQGYVAECGPPHELKATPGTRFHELWEHSDAAH